MDQLRVHKGTPAGGRWRAAERAASGATLDPFVDGWGDEPEVLSAPPWPEQVVVKDRRGDKVRLTPGVLDSEAKYVFSSGQCLALAVAVSEQTGWPVHLRMGRGPIGRSRKDVDYVIHATVLTPDGKHLDAHGVHEPGSWVESGHEIEAQVVEADDATALLESHGAGLQHQDADAASYFVDAVLDENDLG